MAGITSEEIKRNKKAIKWHQFQSGTIYTFVSTRLINVQSGEECILFLGNGTKVFAPCVLMNLLKRENKPFPRYVRPKGRKNSKKKSRQKIFGFFPSHKNAKATNHGHLSNLFYNACCHLVEKILGVGLAKVRRSGGVVVTLEIFKSPF